MKNKTSIQRAILWVAAIAAITYLFKGETNVGMAIIILGVLGFVDYVVIKEN